MSVKVMSVLVLTYGCESYVSPGINIRVWKLRRSWY